MTQKWSSKTVNKKWQLSKTPGYFCLPGQVPDETLFMKSPEINSSNEAAVWYFPESPAIRFNSSTSIFLPMPITTK